MVFFRGRRLLVTLTALVLALVGCSGPGAAQPATATLPAQADVPPWARVPLEARSYLADVALYTSPGYLTYAHQLPPDDLDRVVATLESLEVPPDLRPAHDALLHGYRVIARGRRLMVDHIGDNLLQEEARNQMDFGKLRFQEHLRQVEAYLEGYGVTAEP